MLSDKKPEDDKRAAASSDDAKAPAMPLKGGVGQDMPAAATARSSVARPEIVRRSREYGSAAMDDRSVGSYGEGKKLIVGREIDLNGKISSCEKLVVEGRVEANISECREIEIAESGVFVGEAEIEVAEVSGTFQGTINAKDLELVKERKPGRPPKKKGGK